MSVTTKKIGTWAATLLAATSCGWALWTVAGDLGDVPPRAAQVAIPRPAPPPTWPVTPLPGSPSATPPPTSPAAVPGPDPTGPAQSVVGRPPVVTTPPGYPPPTVEFPPSPGETFPLPPSVTTTPSPPESPSPEPPPTEPVPPQPAPECDASGLLGPLLCTVLSLLG